MSQYPTLGARVRYPGGTVVGPCTGTVVAIYEDYRYAKVDDNASDEELRRAAGLDAHALRGHRRRGAP